VTTAAVRELLHILSSHPCCRDAGEGRHSAAGRRIQPSHSNPLQRASSQRVVISCRTSSPWTMLGGEEAAHASCCCAFAGARSDREPTALLLWPAPRPSPATILPRKWRDERHAWCLSKHLPLKCQGRDCMAPGKKASCDGHLPSDRKRAGRPSLCQHGSSSPSASRSTAVQALTQERNQGCLSHPQRGSEPWGCSQGCCGCARAEPWPSTRQDRRDIAERGVPAPRFAREHSY